MVIGLVSSLFTNFSGVICMLLFNKCKNTLKRENRVDKGIEIGELHAEIIEAKEIHSMEHGTYFPNPKWT